METRRWADLPQSASGVSVLFDSDGYAKVADFGLAKILDRDTSTTRSLVGVSPAMSSVFLAGDRSKIRYCGVAEQGSRSWHKLTLSVFAVLRSCAA
jgi:hypothetical protein